MRQILSYMCLSFVFSAAASTFGGDEPKFKPVIPTDSVQFARLFSSDKRVGTMIFDNFVLDTEIGRGSLPSVNSRKFSYVVQPESDKEVCVVQMIRGFVQSQGSGSAMFVIHAGGKTTTVDLDKAIESAKGGSERGDRQLREQARKLAAEGGFKSIKRSDKSDDFFVELKRHVPVGKPLQTSFVLLVDRLTGDDGSGAMLAIDSIGFEVLPVAQSKR